MKAGLAVSVLLLRCVQTAGGTADVDALRAADLRRLRAGDLRAVVLAFFAAALIPGLFLEELFFEDLFADLRADFRAVFFDALFFAGLRLVAAFAMIQVPSANSPAVDCADKRRD